MAVEEGEGVALLDVGERVLLTSTSSTSHLSASEEIEEDRGIVQIPSQPSAATSPLELEEYVAGTISVQ